MIRIFTQYAPRANAPNTDYPVSGSFKTETIPEAEDGTPLALEWLNDDLGFSEKIIVDSGITPSDIPDTGLESDRLNGLEVIFGEKVDTIADLRTVTIKDTTKTQIFKTLGSNAKGDGGGNEYLWASASVLVDNGGTIIKVTAEATGRLISINSLIIDLIKFGAFGDDLTDDSASFLNAFAFASGENLPVKIPPKTFKLSSTLAAMELVNKLFGDGWHIDNTTLTGSIINTDQGLLFKSTPDLGRGLILKDFGISYTGVGTAITVDNIIISNISNLYMDLNSVGAVGIHYTDDTYFGTLKNVNIKSFTNVAVIMDIVGTKSVVKDCILSASTGSNATAALEIRNEGVSVYDGQINVDRNDDLGIGVWFNNKSGATKTGGLVKGTLAEFDTGTKITGDTHGWSGIIIENTRYTMGNVSTAVIFDRATQCKLIDPAIFGPTSNFLAEFTANAFNCGIFGGYDVCRSNLIVHASSTNCYKRCTQPLDNYDDRANITIYANFMVTCDYVQYVGKTIHNGIAWDKYSALIADDGFATFVPPANNGLLRVRTTTGGNEFLLANYTVVGTAELYVMTEGLSTDGLTTDGTLNGTTGVDGDLTIRASSADGLIYVENRRGAQRRVIVEFE